MSAINWQEEFDGDDNSVWEGASPYTSEGGPDAVPDIYWRLRQRLSNNRVEWHADHDQELGGRTGEMWMSLEEAKADIQSQHDDIIATECDVL